MYHSLIAHVNNFAVYQIYQAIVIERGRLAILTACDDTGDLHNLGGRAGHRCAQISERRHTPYAK